MTMEPFEDESTVVKLDEEAQTVTTSDRSPWGKGDRTFRQELRVPNSDLFQQMIKEVKPGDRIKMRIETDAHRKLLPQAITDFTLAAG